MHMWKTAIWIKLCFSKFCCSGFHCWRDKPLWQSVSISSTCYCSTSWECDAFWQWDHIVKGELHCWLSRASHRGHTDMRVMQNTLCIWNNVINPIRFHLPRRSLCCKSQVGQEKHLDSMFLTGCFFTLWRSFSSHWQCWSFRLSPASSRLHLISDAVPCLQSAQWPRSSASTCSFYSSFQEFHIISSKE